MKTYSRKKAGEPEEVIIDLNEICRLCMAKEPNLVPIYNNDDAIPLTLRIMACLALEVFDGDGLPDKICSGCQFQLEKSYSFRKKCEQSDVKLRQHLREFTEKCEESELEETIESETEMVEMEQEQKASEINTEEDLVGVTKVTYIQPDQDTNEDPENITLPSETDPIKKAACTLKNAEMKTEVIEQDGDGMFVVEEGNEIDDSNMDAIADAVKATLASQPGINLNGEIQLKVNQTEGRSTQVEVTTEDGAVILMELLTEEEQDLQHQEEHDQQQQHHHQQQQIVDATSQDIVNEHGELKIFKCPECPKAFARRIQLRRHASVHMQQRGFSCGICEKWFPTKSALIRHERIHTGERPFQCEVCQKCFAQKEILFRHLMTHTGQKPYNCPHCDKGFTQKEPLRNHIRTHIEASSSEIQLHYCTICPKVFCHASGLSRHLVTHTGKTFRCHQCDKSFTDKSSLRRHHIQARH